MAITTINNPKDTKNVHENGVEISSFSESDGGDDDTRSIDEGRLQEWNLHEFMKQLLGMSAGIVIMFGCCIQSALSINEFAMFTLYDSLFWNSTGRLLDENKYSDWDEYVDLQNLEAVALIVSWNLGAMLGAIIGAYVVPIAPKRTIYACATVSLLFSSHGFYTYQYYARARLCLGIVYGLIQLTIIVQAAEATTKKIRRTTLIIVTFVCAVSNLISILIVYYYDRGEHKVLIEEREAITVISCIIIGMAVLSLILNTLFTQETIPFLLNRGDDNRAFKIFSQMKVEYLSMIDIRYEFERIRFDIEQERLLDGASFRARAQYVMRSMCGVRMLNLLFTNIPFTTLIVYDGASDGNGVKLLAALAMLQLIRLIFGGFITVASRKYHFNRFCYKLSFVCGMALVIAYLTFLFLGPFYLLMETIFWPFSLIVISSFLLLPIPLDVLQYCQTADGYARVRNTWSISFAICLEQFVHAIWIMQMDMFFELETAFLIIGAAMTFLSYWLLKHMPNAVAVHPITVAILARYPFKRAEHVETIHI